MEEPWVFRIADMTPEQFVSMSIKIGIHNPDGTLTEKYKTPEWDLPKKRKRKKK